MDINFSDVEKLIKIAENADIGEIEITNGSQTIRITCQAPQALSTQLSSASQYRSNSAMSSQPMGQDSLSQHNLPHSQNTSESTTTAAPSSSKEPATPDNGITINSPMVGTFYRKSSPETPNFVEMGSQVQANQTLCIIEAMKIMHEVKAEKAGKITAILVEDGAMVEYGEALFTILD